MFPSPCGDEFARRVAAGADPKLVIPDDYIIVRGGSNPVSFPGQPFSAAVGPSLHEAAAAVPHGQIRVSTVGEIRARGGVVEWSPERSRYGTLNQQHANVTEAGPTVFPAPAQSNPVPRLLRIDGTAP